MPSKRFRRDNSKLLGFGMVRVLPARRNGSAHPNSNRWIAVWFLQTFSLVAPTAMASGAAQNQEFLRFALPVGTFVDAGVALLASRTVTVGTGLGRENAGSAPPLTGFWRHTQTASFQTIRILERPARHIRGRSACDGLVSAPSTTNC